MFHWLRDQIAAPRRKSVCSAPEWEDFRARDVAHYCMLDAVERAELRAMMQVFLRRSIGRGVAASTLPTRFASPLAAQACLLQLDSP